MNSENLFAIESLSHRWAEERRGRDNGQAPVLEIRNLRIAQGECLALVGPNGSGKTTLLKVLNGLLPLGRDSQVNFAGEPLSSSAQLRHRTVYLHQSPYLLAGSVQGNVAWPCRERGYDWPETNRRVRSALERVSLAHLAHRDRRALSGGETQRVALARALAIGPDVFLLDEPTTSVDAASLETIRLILRDLKAEGCTIIMASHDIGLVADLADRIIELQAGRVVSQRENLPGTGNTV